MKKTQKKLGNKGFSLVELIVVIAIMAVLVGVLAPTLIRNVEKSRESTDIQNLDSIRTSVTTALSNESVSKYLPTGDAVTVIKYGTTLGTGNLNTALETEMKADSALGVKLKSSAAREGDIYIIIDSNGRCAVGVYKNAPGNMSAAAITCKRNTGSSFISE